MSKIECPTARGYLEKKKVEEQINLQGAIDSNMASGIVETFGARVAVIERAIKEIDHLEQYNLKLSECLDEMINCVACGGTGKKGGE